MVYFTLPSTTNEMISISTSQTFRSWLVIFHLRQPMAFLSLNLYDTPGLAPRMNVLFWGPGDFPVSYSNRDTSWTAWNRHSGSFIVDTGILFSNMKVSLSRMLNDILTLDQQWLPNQSDFPPISWPWYRLWPSPNYEWFPWSICNGCGMPAGNAYPSGHLVPSPILGLANAPIVETKFLELAMSLLDFSPRIPLGTFSILLIYSNSYEKLSNFCCRACNMTMSPTVSWTFDQNWFANRTSYGVIHYMF